MVGIKLVEERLVFRLVGDAEKGRTAFRGPAGRRDTCDGILDRRFSDDFRGSDIAAKKIKDQFARAMTGVCFSGIRGGKARGDPPGDAPKIPRQSLRVLCDLCPTCPPASPLPSLAGP